MARYERTEAIENLIPYGENRRITSKEITRVTGISGANIRKEVNKMRGEFFPIASDDRGYYLAETPQELDHTIAQLNSRIHMMIVAREGLKKAQKIMEQERAEFDEPFFDV